MKLDRRFVADRTVWTHLVVVSTPSLAFCARLVERKEPIRVQTFGSELAVERFDEGVVGRFSWPAEVERHALHVGPEIELLADELRAIVDADCLWISELFCTTFERVHDVAA